MANASELEEIMAKDVWTREDCQRLQWVLASVRDPASKLRLQLARLSGENPDPSGTVAVKLGIGTYMLGRFADALELLSKGTDNKERRFYQALSHKQLHQWSESLENFQRAEDRGWDPRQVNLQVIETQCLAGDVAGAKRSLERFARSRQ